MAVSLSHVSVRIRMSRLLTSIDAAISMLCLTADLLLYSMQFREKPVIFMTGFWGAVIGKWIKFAVVGGGDVRGE